MSATLPFFCAVWRAIGQQKRRTMKLLFECNCRSRVCILFQHYVQHQIATFLRQVDGNYFLVICRLVCWWEAVALGTWISLYWCSRFILIAFYPQQSPGPLNGKYTKISPEAIVLDLYSPPAIIFKIHSSQLLLQL